MKCLIVLGILAVAVALTDAFGSPIGVAFKGDNGKYLGRYTRAHTDNIEVIKNGKDRYTRFRATQFNGKLLLQADNGKYLCRKRRYQHDRYMEKIEAIKDTPDTTCLFTVHNQEDGTVVLQADNGKFMSRVNHGGVDYYTAEKDAIDEYCKLHLEFQIFSGASITGSVFGGPVGVAFKGDNGRYLGRVNRWGIDNIWVIKNGKDPYTRFRATQSNGKLLLQADNGKYLARVTRWGVDRIEAAKSTPDTYCYFTVHNQQDGTVVLQADNGQFMSQLHLEFQL